MSRTSLVARLGLATLVGVASTAALAHSKSEVTTPDDGATVASVETIEIQFDAPMTVTAVSLEGDAGDVALERESGMEPVEVFRARPGGVLEAGDYRVKWRGLSADGHPMQGGFGFTVNE